MWKLFIFLFICCFLFPIPVFAHVRGLPIMKINGVDTQIYPAQATSSLIFNIPADADIAPQQYIKGQKFQFMIDPKNLPVSQDILQKTLLTWDFGDGTKPEKIKGGLEIGHTYKKIGTFIMQVIADYESAGYEDLGKQPVQTTVLHILPSKNYQLPKATITVDGKISSEKKIVERDLNKWITFQVTPSKSTDSLFSYEWDLGDGTMSTDTKVSHRYRLPQYYATPILRVKDKNGFFTDTFVNIRNSGKNDPNNPELEEFLWNSVKGALILLVILSTGGFVWFWKRRTKPL